MVYLMSRVDPRNCRDSRSVQSTDDVESGCLHLQIATVEAQLKSNCVELIFQGEAEGHVIYVQIELCRAESRGLFEIEWWVD
jgi:hypothetical protein